MNFFKPIVFEQFNFLLEKNLFYIYTSLLTAFLDIYYIVNKLQYFQLFLIKPILHWYLFDMNQTDVTSVCMLLEDQLPLPLNLGFYVNTKAKVCVWCVCVCKIKFNVRLRKRFVWAANRLSTQPIHPKKYLGQYRLKITTKNKFFKPTTAKLRNQKVLKHI